MEFNDITMEQVVFEVRYERGFLYWDNFGKLWRGLTEKWPDLVKVKVTPDGANLRWKEKYIDVNFGPDQSLITQHVPKKFDDICEMADHIVKLINEYVEIETFSRLGNRFIGFLPFETEEEAAQAVLDTAIVSINKDKTKHLGKALKEIGIRLTHHDDDVGCTVNLSSVKRQKTEVFPGELKLPWFNKINMMIDVDYFSTKPVDFGIVNGGEFIEANLRKYKLFVGSL